MGITRLAAARLKTEVIEDILVFENEVTDSFTTFVFCQATFTDEILAAGKPKISFAMWNALSGVFHNASILVLYLDGLLEGTAYREKQRRGEYGHLTTTARERKME